MVLSPLLVGLGRFSDWASGLQAASLGSGSNQPQKLEAAERIALPIICFASRCLAVLATPPLRMNTMLLASQLSRPKMSAAHCNSLSAHAAQRCGSVN